MATILTFAEQRDGKLRRASLEVVSEARRLAGALGATRHRGRRSGPGAESLAARARRPTAPTACVVFDDAAFGAYATEAYARALAQAIARREALGRPRPLHRDGQGPRAARGGEGRRRPRLRLRGPLEAKGGKLVARRPMYAGKAYATVEWAGEPQMATLRPNVFAARASRTRRGRPRS